MRRILFIFVQLFIVGQLTAQTFSLGPRLGINMTSLTHYAEKADYDTAQNSQFIGMHTGLITNFAFTENLSLQTEFLYSRKGHKLTLNKDTTDYSQEGTYKYILDYIEVPVLLKASFGPSEVRFFLNAGPYWGYWMGGKSKYKLEIVETDKETINLKEKESIDFDSDWPDGSLANRTDFGVIFGGGFAYESGPGYILIDFRYSMSLRDINTWEDLSLRPDDYKDFKNRVFAISFGYVYQF